MKEVVKGLCENFWNLKGVEKESVSGLPRKKEFIGVLRN